MIEPDKDLLKLEIEEQMKKFKQKGGKIKKQKSRSAPPVRTGSKYGPIDKEINLILGSSKKKFVEYTI